SSIQSIVSHALAVDHQLKTFDKSPQKLLDETEAVIERSQAEFQQRIRPFMSKIDTCIEVLREELARANPKPSYMVDMEDWIRRYGALRESLAECEGWADEGLYEGLFDLHWNRWRAPAKGKMAEHTRTLRSYLTE